MLAAAIFILSPGVSAAAPTVEQTLDVLKANPEAMSAVRLFVGNGAPFCTIGAEADKTTFADNDRIAVLYSPAFRAWHGRGAVTRYTEVKASVPALFQAMKTVRCQIVVEKAKNIVALVNLLDQDEMRYSILPAPLGPEELAEAFAASLGFASHADLVLAGHMMASNEELRVYARFGIKTAAAYDEALARMQSQGYSQDKLDMLAFLADEAEGNRRNLTPAAIREERLARTAATAK
ncbi:hypothetical protein [Noviherbaspirillum sp. ST9]|uniref:hypothetical protein n=1 Tax=Noviherbaspirillum sp. ST9 TaxID=3401606 RepID=UPI003B586EA1